MQVIDHYNTLINPKMECYFTDTSHESIAITSNTAGFHNGFLNIPSCYSLHLVKFNVVRTCIQICNEHIFWDLNSSAITKSSLFTLESKFSTAAH